MKEVESLSGVSGILRPFKKYVEDANLPKNSQIVFYGCPGTCTPFVELIAYAIRTLPVEIVFVPFLNEEKAVILKLVESVGVQAYKSPEKLNPAITVLMGGLAMDNVSVTAEDAKKIISKYPVKTIGTCFLSIFEKEKWTDIIDFDMLIDTPVFTVKIFK